MKAVRQIAALVHKDLLAEFREGHALFSVFLFALLLLLLFHFALSLEPALLRRISPGLFWLALFFSSTLALQHSFGREVEDGQWEGLLLLKIDPKVLYCGKLLSHLIFITILQALLVLPMILLFDLSPNRSLAVVFFLGGLGISIVGTFYASLTATLREGPLLLPLLLFPMMIPILLATVQATELALWGDLMGQKEAWLKLLVVFDTVFLLGSLLLAEQIS